MDKTMKVTVDGIELEVKISEEELAKLTKGKEPKKTGYERVDCSQEYCVVGSDGRVECLNELGDAYDDDYYKTANYYTDVTLAENNARADKLMHQLRRFAAENCEEVKWDGVSGTPRYAIVYDYTDCMLSTWFFSSTDARNFGQIYFDTKENARKAIDIFKCELIWYFTEYRDRA